MVESAPFLLEAAEWPINTVSGEMGMENSLPEEPVGHSLTMFYMAAAESGEPATNLTLLDSI